MENKKKTRNRPVQGVDSIVKCRNECLVREEKMMINWKSYVLYGVLFPINVCELVNPCFVVVKILESFVA